MTATTGSILPLPTPPPLSPGPAPIKHEVLGNLTLLPENKRGGACLDGSPPGYWWRQATSATAKHRWIVHAAGGGWCFDQVTCARRAAGNDPDGSRGSNNLGSSITWANTTSACESGWLSWPVSFWPEI
jgi:hypothetical protein